MKLFARITNLAGSKIRAVTGFFKKGDKNTPKLPKFHQLYFSPAGGPHINLGTVCFAEGSKMEGGGSSINAEIKRLSERILSECGYPEEKQAYEQLIKLLSENRIEKIDGQNLELIERLVDMVIDPSLLVGLIISTQEVDYLKHFLSKFIPSDIEGLHDAVYKNRELIHSRFSFEQRKILYLHLNVPKRYSETSGMGKGVWESIAYSLIHPNEFITRGLVDSHLSDTTWK